MPTVPPQRPRAPRRRIARWILLGFVVLVAMFGAALAWDLWSLRSAASDLTQHARSAQAAVTARDADALASEVVLLQDAADQFSSHSSGPHWTVASWLPWLQNQTVPLQQAGASVHAVAHDALEPLAEGGSLSALESPPIADGRIDPSVLEPFRARLEQAARVLSEQSRALSTVDLSGSMSLVQDNYGDLESQVGELRALVQGAHVAAELLPPMLGAEGPRTYLVMVQNNAEPRTTGGIPGAVLEVEVQDGRFALVGYSAAGAMANPSGVDVDLTDDEHRLFTERMAIYPQDVNFTPEYPRSAELMAAFWRETYGDDVDGVLSLDPVALGFMLEGMPATEIAGVTVTSDNLAEVMMRDSYVLFPEPEQSDAFFARAAHSLFGVLLSGTTNTVAGVERSIEAGRFALWSADESEQELLATTDVSGAFLQHTDALGIFINDGSGSKIGYYIDTRVSVADHACGASALGGQTVTVTLAHTYDGAVSDLPEYVAGGWLEPAGEFHANVLLYPAVGTGVQGASLEGAPAQMFTSTHDGRPFTSVRVALSPGDEVILEYDLAANAAGVDPPTTIITPGPRDGDVDHIRGVAWSNC
ncbi:DUF4012 domain-containing protein [Demequina activiva]|uniref:DUF4012 domain-containing protein n=1 Tax=Demequina activiva TaxID=1582364 RepID=A0A919Q0Q6_9MICO|nr:DUF4012 domain-containing protein [Demequina activiva]GIG53791.1 hypothetical protein Dac01nite_05430 [Demequina activiva]